MKRDLDDGYELDDDRGRWLLHTADAHELYRRFGFTEPGAKTLERARRAASR